MLLADELLQNGITKPQSTEWIAAFFSYNTCNSNSCNIWLVIYELSGSNVTWVGYNTCDILFAVKMHVDSVNGRVWSEMYWKFWYLYMYMHHTWLCYWRISSYPQSTEWIAVVFLLNTCNSNSWNICLVIYELIGSNVTWVGYNTWDLLLAV